jgi:hypothetical protein
VLIQLADRAFDAVCMRWSAPGKGHDRVLVENGFVGVADGATPLGGPARSACCSASGHFRAGRLEPGHLIAPV